MRADASLVQVTGNNLTYVYVVLAISLVALAIAYALRAQVLAQGEGTDVRDLQVGNGLDLCPEPAIF